MIASHSDLVRYVSLTNLTIELIAPAAEAAGHFRNQYNADRGVAGVASVAHRLPQLMHLPELQEPLSTRHSHLYMLAGRQLQDMRALLPPQLVVSAFTALGLRECSYLISLRQVHVQRLQPSHQGYAQLQNTVVSKSFASSTSGQCWQCNSQAVGASMFFCEKCRAIQPPGATPDLFAVMGL